MAWYDDLPAIQKPHDFCDGTGLIDGQPDPACNGTGLEDLWRGQPDQTEWYVKYAVAQLIDVLDKLDALDTKMDTLDNHLDTIENKIDQLLP